MKAIMKMGGRN